MLHRSVLPRSILSAPGDPAPLPTAALLQALDFLDCPIAFISETGWRHVNAAMQVWTGQAAEPHALWPQLERIAGTLLEPADAAGAGRAYLAGGVDVAGRTVPIHARRLEGGPYTDARMVVAWLDLAAASAPDADRLRTRFRLTPQEARVATLLRDGLSNREIARVLFVSPHTARTHVYHVLRKLGVRSRAEVWRALQGA